MIAQAISDDAKSTARKINLEEAPFVDEFLSKYIWRSIYMDTIKANLQVKMMDININPGQWMDRVI